MITGVREPLHVLVFEEGVPHFGHMVLAVGWRVRTSFRIPHLVTLQGDSMVCTSKIRRRNVAFTDGKTRQDGFAPGIEFGQNKHLALFCPTTHKHAP